MAYYIHSNQWFRVGFPIFAGAGVALIFYNLQWRHSAHYQERMRKLVSIYWEEDVDLEMQELNAKDPATTEKATTDNHKETLKLKDVLYTALDYISFPVTYFLGWATYQHVDMSSNNWRQKLYHSFNVAGRFFNPFVEWKDKNTTDVFAFLKWQLTRNNRNGNPSQKELDENLPLMTPNFDLMHNISDKKRHSLSEWVNLSSSITSKASTIPDDIITVTWIGQSTLFIQMDGYNILTDPIFASRTLGWFGPKRLRSSPCKLSDLPPVDIVLVSHNHYDHLDLKVMSEIGNLATWYVPLGLKKWMALHQIENCVELDWWQEHAHDDNLTIVGLPSQHWSGRHFFDVNSTLWASFLCKSKKSSFFHCGDSGYCSAFKEIGDKYGPITLSAIPIGSYEPRYFMCHQHMNPEEACLVHKDIKSAYSIGVHWGTFLMSDEHYMDPKKEFEKARVVLGLEEGSCFTTHIGETKVLRD